MTNSTIISPNIDEQNELRLSRVKITKLASGFDQIEVSVWNESIEEAARLATEVWNNLWSSGDFLMPLPKEVTDKPR